MKNLQELLAPIIAQSGPINRLVYAGCGRLDSVDTLAGLARKIKIFEADKNLKEFNVDAIAEFPHIQYVSKPLWMADKTVTYYRYNFPRFNGLRKVIDAKGRYPNLKLVDEVVLQTQDIGGLEEHSEFDGFVLVLDVNGAEVDLLAQLTNKTLKSLTHIILVLPESGLYGPDEATEVFNSWAGENSWLVTQTIECADGSSFVRLTPDIEQRQTITVDHAVSNLELRQRQMVETFSAERAGLEKTINELRQVHETQIAALEKTHKDTLNSLTQKVAGLEAENERLIQAYKSVEMSVKESEKTHKDTLNSLTQKAAKLEAENQRLVQEREAMQLAMRDLEQRQRLMNEELVRGEAQLTLIKDLLLRDSAF
ncbi:MAG: hypothetical protein LW629_05260 [Burkholderiales bacterium]|nr:hypothetical protein [Burkholderiales bacterium]